MDDDDSDWIDVSQAFSVWEEQVNRTNRAWRHRRRRGERWKDGSPYDYELNRPWSDGPAPR